MKNVLCEIEACRCWFHRYGSLLGEGRTIIRCHSRSGAVFPINGWLRDELLNESIFRSLAHARDVLAGWREDYNAERPHASLDGLTPNEFARRSA